MTEIRFLDNFVDKKGLRDFITMNAVRIVFFSETHGMIPETEIQERILNLVSPDIFLYEMLEEVKIYPGDYDQFLQERDSDDFSIISKFSDLKPTISLAKKFNLPIIGCDLKNMLRENTKFREIEELSKEDMIKEEEIIEKRENRQIEVINRHLLDYSTELLFVSLGAYHLRKNSPIFNRVKSNYILVKPLFDGKEIDEVENPLKCEISYLVTFNKHG